MPKASHGGRFKAANGRALDVEPKPYEAQHLLNAAALLNRRMKELADRDRSVAAANECLIEIAPPRPVASRGRGGAGNGPVQANR